MPTPGSRTGNGTAFNIGFREWIPVQAQRGIGLFPECKGQPEVISGFCWWRLTLQQGTSRATGFTRGHVQVLGACAVSRWYPMAYSTYASMSPVCREQAALENPCKPSIPASGGRRAIGTRGPLVLRTAGEASRMIR